MELPEFSRSHRAGSRREHQPNPSARNAAAPDDVRRKSPAGALICTWSPSAPSWSAAPLYVGLAAALFTVSRSSYWPSVTEIDEWLCGLGFLRAVGESGERLSQAAWCRHLVPTLSADNWCGVGYPVGSGVTHALRLPQREASAGSSTIYLDPGQRGEKVSGASGRRPAASTGEPGSRPWVPPPVPWEELGRKFSCLMDWLACSGSSTLRRHPLFLLPPRDETG